MYSKILFLSVLIIAMVTINCQETKKSDPKVEEKAAAQKEAQEQPQGSILERIDTLDYSTEVEVSSGLLKIDKDSLETPIITFKGETIHKCDMCMSLSFWQKFLFNDHEAVLIMESSGGMACPSLFTIITIKKDGTAEIFPTFGNCSEEPEIVAEGNNLIFNFSQSGESPGVTWLYQNMKLTEIDDASGNNNMEEKPDSILGTGSSTGTFDHIEWGDYGWFAIKVGEEQFESFLISSDIDNELIDQFSSDETLTGTKVEVSWEKRKHFFPEGDVYQEILLMKGLKVLD